MRIALTAFAFFFGMLAHAACLAPCSYGAEDAYAFDADGNIVEAANDIAYEAFVYDDTGWLSESVTEICGVTFALSWSRDMGGLVTNVSYGAGKAVSRTYDLAGRLVAVRDWLGHEWTFAYDAGPWCQC